MNILNFIKKNKYKIAFIFWMGVIFGLSNIKNLSSDIPGIDDFILRKLAHVAEYIILMFLCIKAFLNNGEKIKFNKKLILCFLFCSLYALSDEFHQGFIETRHFSLVDWGIDNFGLVIGIIGAGICKKMRNEK